MSNRREQENAPQAVALSGVGTAARRARANGSTSSRTRHSRTWGDADRRVQEWDGDRKGFGEERGSFSLAGAPRHLFHLLAFARWQTILDEGQGRRLGSSSRDDVG